jgi:hypothetical protein
MKVHQKNSKRRSIARLTRQMAIDAALGCAFGALVGLILGGFKPSGAVTIREHFVFALSVSTCCGISTALLGLFNRRVYCEDAGETVSRTVCSQAQPAATATVAVVEFFPRMLKPAPAEILRTSA